jgi:hypothetical protein
VRSVRLFVGFVERLENRLIGPSKGPQCFLPVRYLVNVNENAGRTVHCLFKQ